MDWFTQIPVYGISEILQISKFHGACNRTPPENTIINLQQSQPPMKKRVWYEVASVNFNVVCCVGIEQRYSGLKYKKVGIVQSNVSSVGPLSERNQTVSETLDYYLYWQYTNLFIFGTLYIPRRLNGNQKVKANVAGIEAILDVNLRTFAV